MPPISALRIVKHKNDVIAELANAGVNLFTTESQNQWLKSLQTWGKKNPSFTAPTRLGWTRYSYILPNKIFGDHEKIFPALQELNSEMLAKYRVRGTLDDWKKTLQQRASAIVA